MVCSTCRVLVPDDAKICPRCGSKIAQEGAQSNEMSWMVNRPRNYGEEKREFVLEATDSIKKTFYIRLGQTLITLFTFILALMSFTSSIYFIYEHEFLFGTIPKILTAVNLVLWVLLLLRLSDLQGYEERFATTLRYAALWMIFSLASLFLSEGIAGLLISIGGLISGVLFMYHYCGAFSDLTGMVDEGISGKWELMLKIYIGATILQLGGLLMLYFKATNASTISQMVSAINSAYLWSFIIALLGLLVMVIELIVFIKTIKCFESQR